MFSHQPLYNGVLLCLALSAAGTVRADEDVGAIAVKIAQAARESLEFERRQILNEGGETMRFAAAEMGGERVVKGAPYCAEAVHETVQWLPDGSGGAPNRIVRQQNTLLCRDGEGRTRQEVQRGSRKLVYLRDPVAGESWALDVERKTARRMNLRGGAHVSLDGAAWRDYAERMKDWARSMADKSRGQPGSHASAMSPTPPTPPIAALPPVPAAPPVAGLPPTPVVISRPESAPRDVEVSVVRMHKGGDHHDAADWALPPPAVQWRAQSWAPRGAGTVIPLGSRDVEGQRANGDRTTWVIEAGKVGNEKPIQITREVWTAPDLMITLSSRDFDPRSGEVNYRLKNIKRGEPDAALMRVPADYKLPAPPGGRASGPSGRG